MSAKKKLLTHIIPWTITLIALYYAFLGVNWEQMFSHIAGANLFWICIAFIFTVLSYFARSKRWIYFFPKNYSIAFNQALKVLLLGFFMNNVLPARSGELVRAHIGGRVVNLSRTIVLATIASERLFDGLMISLMFIVFALHLGNEGISNNLLYVAFLFLFVLFCVITILLMRQKIFNLISWLNSKIQLSLIQYLLKKSKLFIEGLTPIFNANSLVSIVFWTIVVWILEAVVYIVIPLAFQHPLPLSYSILFLVAVNFSSLIPAAPGGIGVIEAATTVVLTSLGLEKELALSMVLCQHLIQYLVVGLPGLVLIFSWKNYDKIG